jgi:ATP-dependent helicase/nuclease subunit A
MREVDLPSIASPISKLSERIAEQIEAWLEDHTYLPSRKRPIRAGDIMILLPRREPFAAAIISALKDRGIPVSGADRMHLTDQIVVKDLIALARFVLLPDDDLTAAALLRSPLFDVDEHALFTICHGRRGSVWQELSRRREERPEFGEAHAFLSDLLRRADYIPPFEFFAYVLSARGARRRFLARLGSEAGDAIEEFLSLTLNFEAENSPSLDGFLHWILRGGAEIKRDMERGRDEVRVMTVHGAKGLESDIVILPDTTTVPQTPSQKGQLLYDGQHILFPVTESLQPPSVANAKHATYAEVMREHRRLFYVALTRARDRLYICGAANKQGIKEGSWYRLAESAATSLGIELSRFGGTVRVIGDADDRYGEPPQSEIRRPELPTWLTTPPAAEDEMTVRPSELGSSYESGPSHRVAAGPGARRGSLIHALLARLPEIAEPERRVIAERFLRSHGVPEDEIDSLTSESLGILDHPDFKVAFAHGTRAEVPVAADVPEIAPGMRIDGRIDRLAVTDDEVLIVDFKTDRVPPANESEVPASYVAQMACYRAAMARIFPEHRICCALVWTGGPRLMALSDARLDGEIAAIRLRLDRGEQRP